MSVAAVILAAGASVRFGRPKQIAMLGDERLLERTVRIAQQAGCSPVIVVLGAYATEIAEQCELTGAETVVNDAWQEGMSSSLRAGLARLQARDLDGAVLIVCDQPAVSPDHLRALVRTGFSSGSAVGSRYAGRTGVPAYLPAAQFAHAMLLTGDQGARDLLQEAAWQELPDGELDVDTPELLERARHLVQDRSGTRECRASRG